MDYTLDRWGERVYPGDYVECLTDEYYSIRKGNRSRVKEVKGDCIVLNNKFSPTLDSPYRAENFRLSGRYHPFHHNGVDKRRPAGKYETNSEKEANTMLHIAIRIDEGASYGDLATAVRATLHPGRNDGDLLSAPTMIADVTASALKERIKARINQSPAERWLILSGNTIAETSAPPISFRQW